jgi:hypothetical protein
MDVGVIANEWLNADHEPQHESYKAFTRETMAQYRQIVSSGLKISFYGDSEASATELGFVSSVGGYATSADMFQDLRENNHFSVYTGGSPLCAGHPLAEVADGVQLNVMFRTVHDIYGHLSASVPFETKEGELLAYLEHKRRYSPKAIQALYSETVGQLCVYFHTGDFVKEQKCSIIPVRL